jgi:hypothetical protein
MADTDAMAIVAIRVCLFIVPPLECSGPKIPRFTAHAMQFVVSTPPKWAFGSGMLRGCNIQFSAIAVGPSLAPGLRRFAECQKIYWQGITPQEML